MTFWWVLGGMTVLTGAIVLRDKTTRRKVIRGFARRWDRGRARTKKQKARNHVRARRASATTLTQVKPTYARPRRPKLLATKCSAACRTSRKPAFDRKTGRLLCDCPCGGREHGMYRPGGTSTPKVTPKRTAAGSNGTAKTPAAKTPAMVAVAPMVPTPAPLPKVPPAPAPTPRTSPPLKRVSGKPGPKWAAPSMATYERMRAHVAQNPGCKAGAFSMRTFHDRRHDPPKITQEASCDTCGKGC